MGCGKICGAAVCVLVGYVLWTARHGVRPPVVPASSMVGGLPPWPIFKVLTGLSHMFTLAGEATTPPKLRALELAMGYTLSAATYGLMRNGVLDAVPREGGATCEETAGELELNVDMTCRFMQFGVVHGLFTTAHRSTAGNAETVFTTTAVGDALRADELNSVRNYALFLNEELPAAWYAAARESLKTSESGFLHAYGQDFFDWLEGNDSSERLFNDAMAAVNPLTSAMILGDYPLGDAEVICDVGGGRGGLLAEIARHYPDPSLVLFDLPGAVASPVAELPRDRTTFLAGSFFDAPLPDRLRTCDVIFMKHVLHDWQDSAARTILANVVNATKPGARLAIVEVVLDDASVSDPFARFRRYMDLNMLALCPKGSRERTLDELADLLPDSVPKDTLSRIALRGPPSIVELVLP